MNMSNRDSRHSARKASARQLQRTYPGLKYTAAYAACSRDAVAWRNFADAFSVDMYICSDICLRVTGMLLDAGNRCPDMQGQQALLTVSGWANELSMRLVQVHSHVLFVNAVMPLAPTRFELSGDRGALPARPAGVGELSTAGGETAVAVAIMEPLREGRAQIPPEVLEIVDDIIALHRWVRGI